MATYAKRNAAMLTTIGAMAAGLLLIIFFGAWAVSDGSRAADAGTLLSGATAGFSGATLPTPPPAPSSIYPADANADASADAATAPRLATAPDGSAASANPADTWWGKALLAACPLH